MPNHARNYSNIALDTLPVAPEIVESTDATKEKKSDTVKSIFDSSKYDTDTYRKLFSVAFDEYKRIREDKTGEANISVDDAILESIVGNADGTAFDEVLLMYGYLTGLHSAAEIIEQECTNIIGDGKAYIYNKNYAVLKRAFDKIVTLFFEPVKRVQYTKGKNSAMAFFEFIQYGGLLDIKELLYKLRYSDIPKITKQLRSHE